MTSLRTIATALDRMIEAKKTMRLRSETIVESDRWFVNRPLSLNEQSIIGRINEVIEDKPFGILRLSESIYWQLCTGSPTDLFGEDFGIHAYYGHRVERVSTEDSLIEWQAFPFDHSTDSLSIAEMWNQGVVENSLATLDTLITCNWCQSKNEAHAKQCQSCGGNPEAMV